MRFNVKISCFIAIALALATVSCSSGRRLSRTVMNETSFKIKEIFKGDKLFYITAERNDSVFEIISLIDTLRESTNPISEGDTVDLSLVWVYNYGKRLFPIRYDDAKKESVWMRFTKVNDKCHNSLYVAKNLDGLDIVESENDLYKRIAVIPVTGIFDNFKDWMLVLALLPNPIPSYNFEFANEKHE